MLSLPDAAFTSLPPRWRDERDGVWRPRPDPAACWV